MNFLAAAIFIGLTALAARAADTEPAPERAGRPDLQSFRIIPERNIFNPNRSQRREQSRAEREPERRVQTDSLALLGTMRYDKGWLAFFDGSQSDYRKALRPGDIIAGYIVREIAPNHVKLEGTNSQAVEVRVGTQMKRRDEGPWEISARTEPVAAAAPSSGTNTSTPSSDEGESDVIKKLMQRREQETQK